MPPPQVTHTVRFAEFAEGMQITRTPSSSPRYSFPAHPLNHYAGANFPSSPIRVPSPIPNLHRRWQDVRLPPPGYYDRLRNNSPKLVVSALNLEIEVHAGKQATAFPIFLQIQLPEHWTVDHLQDRAFESLQKATTPAIIPFQLRPFMERNRVERVAMLQNTGTTMYASDASLKFVDLVENHGFVGLQDLGFDMKSACHRYRLDLG